MGCITSKSFESDSNLPVIKEEPLLKYSGRLVPLNVGHIVTIVAKPTDKAKYFNIFFGTDTGFENDFEDIQFHIAVNFDKNIITRNSYSRVDGWGEPEIEANLAPGNSLNPIKQQELFKIEFFIDAKMYHVSIDNKPFCTFNHRWPIGDIHRINVYGDIDRIYQITHMTPKDFKKIANNDDNALVNVIPSSSSKWGSVMAFSGMPQGSPTGAFEINITDDVTQRVLFQLKANFDDQKVFGASQNSQMK